MIHINAFPTAIQTRSTFYRTTLEIAQTALVCPSVGVITATLAKAQVSLVCPSVGVITATLEQLKLRLRRLRLRQLRLSLRWLRLSLRQLKLMGLRSTKASLLNR
jgi:hypothetical protein